jgi:hypothetical protein
MRCFVVSELKQYCRTARQEGLFAIKHTVFSSARKGYLRSRVA